MPARNKPHAPGGVSHEKAIKKFLSRHAEGHSKFAAKKELERQTKRQLEHQTRGHAGHIPHPRKVLK